MVKRSSNFGCDTEIHFRNESRQVIRHSGPLHAASGNEVFYGDVIKAVRGQKALLFIGVACSQSATAYRVALTRLELWPPKNRVIAI